MNNKEKLPSVLYWILFFFLICTLTLRPILACTLFCCLEIFMFSVTQHMSIWNRGACDTIDGGAIFSDDNPGARYNFLGGLSYSWDSSNSPFCAGTLVSSRWVITSASCSYADSSVVSPDTVNVLMGLTPVSVDKVIVHSGYSQSGDENNIALWRLAQASKESPLCLPAQGSQQTGTARLVGWRINPLSGYLNEELGEIEVALVEDCGQSGRICSTSSTTQCGGDFGGPLVQGSDTLIGATVSDSGCGGTGGKGLFTQISEHTDWIKRTISGNGGGDVCTNRWSFTFSNMKPEFCKKRESNQRDCFVSVTLMNPIPIFPHRLLPRTNSM